jgi:site-specific DNA-adenine methylase
LYQKWFKEEDHIRLSEFLKSFEYPWLLSYDDSEFIKLLYKNSMSQPIYADYLAWRYKKDVEELLFSNNVIPSMVLGTENSIELDYAQEYNER